MSHCGPNLTGLGTGVTCGTTFLSLCVYLPALGISMGAGIVIGIGTGIRKITETKKDEEKDT